MKRLRRAPRGILVVIGLAAGCAHAAERPPAPSAAAAIGADVVHVAPPTGVLDADRASISAALAQVRPGGTVHFAPGTYLVGEILPVPTPRITLLGHPQGTTLRGCDPAGYEEMEWAASRAGRDWSVLIPIVRSCGTFELSGGHSTIRALTFEYTRMGVILGCCHAERDRRLTDGGYLIEGNTFRNSGNGIRPGMLSADPTVIRGNTFINTFHAVSAWGGHLHILENDISVPEPHRVPGVGHPSFAIALCGEHNHIVGNRIEGHPDGILLIADPGDVCRENVIRDNTIAVRRVPFPARRPYADMPRITDEGDSTIVGVPLLLHAIAGEQENGIVEANLIEGNRLVGSDGIAVEVAGASRNRFVENTISGVVTRTSFPGNTLGSNAGWGAANGSGIWLSHGSDENEIVGNRFSDIASYAIVIEGDRNRVEVSGPGDAVRDLGSGNQLGLAPSPEDPAEEVRARTEAFFAALSDDSPAFVGPLFYAPDAVLVLPGGVVLQGLEAITREFLRPNVARLRGVRPSSSRLIPGRDTVVWTGAFRARFAPAADTVAAQLSNTWVRQPDGRWLIAASTLELPTRGYGTGEGPIRSRFFRSEGLRLHALDFGGEGVPLVFMPNRDRTAYTFIDFAPRFTDHARVLAVTSRGSGHSEGEADGAPGIAALGRDLVALLDSLQVERAVVAHAWGEVLVYLAEQHPERVTGLVFLAGMPQPDLPALWDADTTGMLQMVPRLIASLDGATPDEGIRALRERWYAARYLRTDRRIDVPALVFMNESETSGVEDRWQGDVQHARRVSAGELSVPDSATRAYFLRLASDDTAQAELRAVHRDLVTPAYRAANERFRRAFGEHLRLVSTESRAIGYGYRQAPELIEPHIRRFLEEVNALERRRSESSIPR
jgi:hypothetical protein